MQTMQRPRFPSVLRGALAVAITVAAAACGGGSDEPDEAATTTTTEAAPTFPLTGLPIEDAALAGRPALVVKIDNAQPREGQGARPQAGLNEADVVFEEVVEGSVTRLVAVFHSTDVDPLGPIRSARTTDLLIMRSLNRPLFAWSGANAEVAGQVREADLVDVGVDAIPDAFYRDETRPAPYNLFSSTQKLRAAAPAEERPPPVLFSYREDDDEPDGAEIGGVSIVFGDGPGSAPVAYAWDGSGWARTQRDEPHVDAAGAQVAPPNVIIRFTPYREVQCCDAVGFPIIEAELVGEGDAWVLSGGVLTEAHWAQTSPEEPTAYTTADGEPVLLAPGRTWVAIAPPGSATRT